MKINFILLIIMLFLAGCGDKRAAVSESLYNSPAWPKSNGVKTQKDVAKYLVKGKAAFDTCTGNLQSLKQINALTVKK